MDASTVADRISCLQKRLDAVQSELNFLIDYLVRQAGDEYYKMYGDYKNEASSLFLRIDHLISQVYETFLVEYSEPFGGEE